MRALAGLLALALAGADARATVQEEVPSPPALERVPTSLPSAEEGRWKDWNKSVPPPEALRVPFLAAVNAYRAGDLPRALAHLYVVLEDHAEYPPALHQMGVIYFRLRRYGDAVNAFERFLAHVPGEVRQTRALGHCYYSLGRYADAERHYARVLAVAPDMVEAVRGAALSHMRLGDPETALELLARVVTLAPEHADAHAWIARILWDEERSEEALEAAERARDLDAYVPKPWFLLAQIYFELGRDDDGLAARERFEELDRAAQEARYLEARLLFAPGRPDVLVKLVEERRRVGDKGRTRGALQRLVGLDPRNYEWNAYALDVFMDLGDTEAAASAAAALEVNCPDVAETWKRLELYYGRIRDRVKQVEAGERYRRMKNEGGG